MGSVPKTRRDLLKMHDLARTGVRQRPQKNTVDDREDCCIGANAEGKRNYRQDRETRIAQKRSDDIRQIMQELFKKSYAVHPPDFFSHTLSRTELDQSLTGSLFFTQTTLEIEIAFELDMFLDLQAQLFITSFAEKEPAHTHASSSPITRPMARTICRQRLVSCTSCRLPAAVSL